MSYEKGSCTQLAEGLRWRFAPWSVLIVEEHHGRRHEPSRPTADGSSAPSQAVGGRPAPAFGDPPIGAARRSQWESRKRGPGTSFVFSDGS